MSRANKRTFPALKPGDETRRFTKKDELYNEVVKIFRERSIDFPQSQCSSEGDYCVSVITNVLWYITNDHKTINTATKHYSNSGTIPKVFENLDGFNDIKRKTMKALPLDLMHRRYTVFYYVHVRRR